MADEFNEPWTYGGPPYGSICNSDGDEIVRSDHANLKDDELSRIVACVNFCRGMPTEQLESWHRIQHERIGGSSDG